MNLKKVRGQLKFSFWKILMYIKGYKKGTYVYIKQYPFLIQKEGQIIGFDVIRGNYMFLVLEEKYDRVYGLCFIHKYYKLEDLHLYKKSKVVRPY
jgi:hypothetical protein